MPALYLYEVDLPPIPSPRREKVAEGWMRGNGAINSTLPPHPSPLPHGEGTSWAIVEEELFMTNLIFF